MLLKTISYYQTGGRCAAFYAPESLLDLKNALQEIDQKGLKLLLLGAGTNSLVLDEYFEGAVLAFYRLNHLRVEGGTVIAEAGVNNTVLSEYCRDHNLDGVAWMNRLPGQIGATVRMNARCYGGEMSQVVKEVTTMTLKGDTKVYREPGMFRGYKDTIFMSNGEVICQAVMELRPGDRGKIQAKMDACADDRVAKGQFLYPSCGCVFKNDYSIGLPSGALLEASGVKAMDRPNLMINPKHANFVFNCGASSEEILEMTFAMREAVYQHFGVWLQYEMEVLGSLSPKQRLRFMEQRPHKPKLEALSELKKKIFPNKA